MKFDILQITLNATESRLSLKKNKLFDFQTLSKCQKANAKLIQSLIIIAMVTKRLYMNLRTTNSQEQKMTKFGAKLFPVKRSCAQDHFSGKFRK